MTTKMHRLLTVAAATAAMTTLLAGCGTTKQAEPTPAAPAAASAAHNMAGMASDAEPKLYAAMPKGAPGELARADGLFDAAYTMDGNTKVFHLTAEAVKWQTDKDHEYTAWSYNGHVPGPVLNVKQGERVRIVVDNKLAEGTSIHWHGLDVPNDQDGVAMVTQDPIGVDKSYTYEFTVPNQYGTDMYHSHHDDLKQITQGLFGPMVITPADAAQEPKVDKDYLMQIGDGGLGYTINGMSFPETKPWAFKKGSTARIRFINIGNQVHPMHLHGFNVTVIAKDGNPLEHPYKVNTVDLLPGDIYDVLVTFDRAGTWAWHCHNIAHVDDGHGNMMGLVQVVKVVE